MRITLNKRVGPLAFLLLCVLASSTTVYIGTNKLVIESGGSAQGRQRAIMEKEQWDDTYNLRQKVNRRTERKQDKADAVPDNHDECEQSANVSACRGPNTLRCLDHRTGRVIIP